MRKFYSLVLMATALLIGTNAWAYSAGWLQTQFDAIQADGQTHTITMYEDIVLTDPVYLGTKTVDEPRKSIILDMNGHHITMDATTWLASHPGVYCSMFTITHGELLVRNNASDRATNPSLIQMTGTGLVDNSGNGYNNIFNVAGSYKSSRWQKSGDSYAVPTDAGDDIASVGTNTRDKGWFTHLEIGEGVKLVADATIGGAGISMDGYYSNYHALVSPDATLNYVFGGSADNPKSAGALTAGAKDVCLFNRADAPAYNTAIMNPKDNGNGEGFAYGLRVDVYGDIEFATAATSGKSYGIKLNGGLKSSLTSSDKFLNRNCWYMDQAYAKTYANAEAPTSSANKTYSVSGDYYENHKLDTIDAPFLYVHSSAHITAAAKSSSATAVYCSGYGKTLIEGECKGNSGVNIKSGTVELHDAVITGTADDYSNAQAGNHATGSGGIIVNSVENRAGGVEVVISGDTKVSTEVGYAIEEVVNTKDGHTDVSSIAIQGGTIEGGNLGAIALTTEGGAATAVTGGNINGEASVAGNTVAVSTLVPNTSQYHTTEVTVDGKTTIVVSQGPAPTGKTLEEAIAAYNAWVAADKTGDSISVKITGAIAEADGKLNADYEFKELELNAANDAQILTVVAGHTLKVGRVVLGENAQIIVEPGAKFIVYGSQGIVAPVASNIVLNASEDLQSIFLFNPAVNSNRDPMAQFKIYTECHEIAPKTAGMKNFVYQRFALPITVAAAPTHDYTDQTLYTGNTAFRTYVKDYNPATNEWEALTSWASLKGFQGYQLGNTTANGGITYTFAGHLYGNQNHDCSFDVPGFEFFGNSYSAPLYIDNLLAAYQNTNIEPTVWIYNYDTRSFAIINEDARLFDSENVLPEEIKTMQAYALYLRNGSDKASIDYKNVVWENPNFDELLGRSNQNNAPARNRMNAMNNGALISVMAENGMKDQVILIEKDSYSSNFDNGADAPKLMVEDGINLYVTTADGNLSIVADNNIENTTLTFKAGEATEYTLQLGKVFGEDYAIRDNVTGAIINCAEGMTYFFNQAANTTAFGRFEIVGRQNMPTAIDNTEAVKSAKGIYSITGMYLGEDLNVLPAGVYVVNGVKVVK